MSDRDEATSEDKQFYLQTPQLSDETRTHLIEKGCLDKFIFLCGMIAIKDELFPFPPIEFVSGEQASLEFFGREDSIEYVDHFGDIIKAPIPKSYKFTCNDDNLKMETTFDLEPLFMGGARKLLSTKVVLPDGKAVESTTYFQALRGSL